MHRTNTYITQKPENILKRINEYIASATGNNAEKEKQSALEQLHNVISVKRKQWTKVYEAIMKRHIELCVDLKDHRTAKDGLHQYRNMVLNVDPQSLENVIVYLIELAETRAQAAKHKANKVALAAAAKVSDLEQEETPESIMLSTMTVEGAKDRTDREVVVPWLKFLWETYRAVLELLHKNVKLEKVYHKTCEKAFKFCLEYHRILEFRRLCDILRTQLSNLQRQNVNQQQGASYTSRIQWDWTAESIEIQLQIRFSQLEAATNLEQWNESFRTVEDIYSIMQQSKKGPKPKLMAIYYEKLTRIFWVSGNYLFHAYAYFRFYNLCLECKKDMKPEDKTLLASSVLLAALCIPIVASNLNSDMTVDSTIEDTIDMEKNQQMAMLLDFQTNPTRTALLNDIVSKGLLDDVYPELITLYHMLETKFQPLTLVNSILPVLQIIKGNNQLNTYNNSLQRVIVIKTVKQLSKVYSCMKIQNVKKLFQNLDISYVEVENILIDGINKKQLHLQINHIEGCYRFGQTNVNLHSIETQLYNIATEFDRVRNVMNEATIALESKQRAQERTAFLSCIREISQNNYSAIQERKQVIERRKEGLERLQLERLRQEDEIKKKEEADRIALENARLKIEEDRRHAEKLAKLVERREITRFLVAMEALGKTLDPASLVDLNEKGRRELLVQAQIEAQQAKEEEAKRLADQARYLDYVTRAMRIESVENVKRLRAETVARDTAEHEERSRALNDKGREEHSRMLADKARLMKTTAFCSVYEQLIIGAQQQAYQQQCIEARRKAIEDYAGKNIVIARREKRDYDDRLEEEAEAERERRERDILEAQQFEILLLRRQQEEELRREREIEEERLREQARAEAMRASRAEVQDANVQRKVSDDGPWMKQGKQRSTEVSRDEEPDRSRRNGPPSAAPFDSKSRSAPSAASESSSWRGGQSSSTGAYRPPSDRDSSYRPPSDRDSSGNRDAGGSWSRVGSGSRGPPPADNSRRFGSGKDQSSSGAPNTSWRK